MKVPYAELGRLYPNMGAYEIETRLDLALDGDCHGFLLVRATAATALVACLCAESRAAS